MEEFQLVFLMWLIKFIAGCAVFLAALRWIDRRWREKTRRGDVTDRSALPLAMSRRRAQS